MGKLPPWSLVRYFVAGDSLRRLPALRPLPCRSLRHLPVRPGRLFLRGSVKGGGSPKSALRPLRRPGVTCERVPKPGRDTGFTERGQERGVPFRLRQSALSLRPGCAHQRFPLRLGGGTKCLTWRDFGLVVVYLLICDWTVRDVADGLSVCLPGRIIACWPTAFSRRRTVCIRTRSGSPARRQSAWDQAWASFLVVTVGGSWGGGLRPGSCGVTCSSSSKSFGACAVSLHCRGQRYGPLRGRVVVWARAAPRVEWPFWVVCGSTCAVVCVCVWWWWCPAACYEVRNGIFRCW